MIIPLVEKPSMTYYDAQIMCRGVVASRDNISVAAPRKASKNDCQPLHRLRRIGSLSGVWHCILVFDQNELTRIL